MLWFASKGLTPRWLSLGGSCSPFRLAWRDILKFRCVISALCDSAQEFQRINPTTQVALAASCIGICDSQLSIQWNVYYGFFNSISNVTQWIPFGQMVAYDQIWFFGNNPLFLSKCISSCLFGNLGRNMNQFTAINRLFVENPAVQYWRFEVIYRFPSVASSSAVNFVMNQAPSNGSCSILPTNGTTSTLFTITCSAWVDENGIKDYSLYGRYLVFRFYAWRCLIRMECWFRGTNAYQLLTCLKYSNAIAGWRSRHVVAFSDDLYSRSTGLCGWSEHLVRSCPSRYPCHQ